MPLGNAGPLGLSAFGLTTTLLNLKNAHILGESSLGMIFGMGLFFGGFAQLIAGTLEFVKGNTFPMVAFTAYGSFWISFCFMHFLPDLGMALPLDAGSVSAYLFMWGLFSAGMFFGTIKLRLNWMLRSLFGTLVILFVLLGISDALSAGGLEKGAKVIQIIGGIEGIGVGLLAIYIAIAEVSEALPLFPVHSLPKHTSFPEVELDNHSDNQQPTVIIHSGNTPPHD
ncbi:acetate uptake transporter [Pelomyxa schiedti]|nr:acetate uptake transporter [Pelomyxa schiedti]